MRAHPLVVTLLATIVTASCSKEPPVAVDAGGRRLPPPLDVFPVLAFDDATETETVDGKETTARHHSTCDVRLPDIVCKTTDLSGAQPDWEYRSRVTKGGWEHLGTAFPDVVMVHDPPQVMVPVDYRIGTTWSETTNTAMIPRPEGEVTYIVTESTSRIEATDVCTDGIRVVRISTRDPGIRNETRNTYCPGRGLVVTDYTRHESGVETTRSHTVVHP